MLSRSALRLSARLSSRRAAVAPQFVARRAASTSAGGHKASSDLPWIASSLVGFGGLTAFILVPSKKTVHHAVTPHDDEKAETNESAPKASTGGDPVESPNTTERAVASEDPKDTHPNAEHSAGDMATKKEGKGEKPSEETKPSAKDGGANANETAQVQKAAEDEEKKDEPEEEKKDGEEKKEAESVEQATKSDAPAEAKEAEEKDESPAEKKSVEQATKSDAPVEAKEAEEKGDSPAEKEE
ncbi:hypothetical protein L202_01177 [Cryptococcus amylolentus CBS 6039]|uniref:Uncharacterized protein n=2 Tax=Cryptococcus amylolentus TaxID=104669 RepID=A0A1E3I2P0_9TREE|nr:hypothetical protein L202_01177 [Cryptococcus amylolentus CBS 6039]ODN82930.1 hypothetical protein L202_01177 [Cryptococcus amylolentus CBS 6039]ODO10569.1 hypothetical protein I350_01166 [Cryptococcus amylolentus CBS 6273]